MNIGLEQSEDGNLNLQDMSVHDSSSPYPDLSGWNSSVSVPQPPTALSGPVGQRQTTSSSLKFSLVPQDSAVRQLNWTQVLQ